MSNDTFNNDDEEVNTEIFGHLDSDELSSWKDAKEEAQAAKDALAAEHQEKNLHAHQHAVKGIGTETGQMALGHDQSEINGGDKNDKNEKKRQREFSDLLRELEGAQRILRERINELYNELNEFIEKRDVAQSKVTALQNILDHYRENGAIEIGQDGYPADAIAKQAIKEFEQKSGKKFDAANTDASEFLRLATQGFETQRDGYNVKIEETNSEIDETSDALEVADDALDHMRDTGEYPDIDVSSAINLARTLKPDITEPEIALDLSETAPQQQTPFIDLGPGL